MNQGNRLRILHTLAAMLLASLVAHGATVPLASAQPATLTNGAATLAAGAPRSVATGVPGRWVMESLTVDASNVEQIKQRSKTTPVIFNVTAPAWCGACQELEPIIQAAAAQSGGTWVLATVDADKAPTVAKGFNVNAYPTVIGYAGGQETSSPARNVGNPGKAGLDSFIAALVANGGGGQDPAPEQPAPTEPVPTQPAPTEPKPDDPDNPTTPAEPIVITSDNYDEFMTLSHKIPVVLDFSKDGCDPCAKLAPVLEEKLTADSGKWALGTLDGTAYPELWEKYQKPWFPTLITIKNGKEVTRRTGYNGEKDEVISWLDKTLFTDEVPDSDRRIVAPHTLDDWAEIYEMSGRHPVAIRLHRDDADEGANRDVLEAMAQADGGKWTLANVALISPGGIYFSVTQDVQQYPTLLVFYNGTVHLDPFAGEGTEAELRAWVDAMLSHKYPVEGDA